MAEVLHENNQPAHNQLPHDKKPKSANIVAAEKIIADISSGIYRSPAAALKELVSNAYDADATRVSITTDVPKFRNLTIEDNGTGMAIEKFLDVITHIGGSRKRMDGDRSAVFGRNLIGRIGIGMLAVAQLGNHFYVSSSVKGKKTRFIAEVNLEPFHRDDAALISMGKMKGSGQVNIGAVKYVDDIPELENVQYTVITVPDAKKGLISEMTSAVRKAVGARERLTIEGQNLIHDFDEVIKTVRSSQRADLVLDGYYYMLWELGLLCPVNYSDLGLFNPVHRHIENIDAFQAPRISQFTVIVDGLDLRRPQSFPNPRTINYSSPDPKIYPIAFDEKIARRRLRFRGYIYSQQPRIDPEEFKGVHIRIRDVGIGKYDKSWLGYPFDEGIKFGQVTGEIFVEEGLEPALNIDRDSFRETDVHYQAMRAYIWTVLRDEVFPDYKQRATKYRLDQRKQLSVAQYERFNQALIELSAPIPNEIKFVKDVAPNISNWIKSDSSGMLINETAWRVFAEETELTNKEVQGRFLRVLLVLASSELLIDIPEDDVNNLLRVLAVAVQ